MLITPIAALILAASASNPEVRVSGSLRAVMRDGDLRATLSLDTLPDRDHLFGLGPLDSLRGELMVEDGTCLKAAVGPDSQARVERTWKAKAPFFAYARVTRWILRPLPDSVRSMGQLESHLSSLPFADSAAFAFRLTGIADSAFIHIVNLPSGARITGPGDAHRGRRDLAIRNAECRVVGFFSKHHQGIFTHHDSYLHAHLVTARGDRMGHLDEAYFKQGGLKLFLPDPAP